MTFAAGEHLSLDLQDRITDSGSQKCKRRQRDRMRAFDALDKRMCLTLLIRANNPVMYKQASHPDSPANTFSLCSHFPWLSFRSYAGVQICSAEMGMACKVG